jgi:hypothetical protein
MAKITSRIRSPASEQCGATMCHGLLDPLERISSHQTSKGLGHTYEEDTYNADLLHGSP